MSYSYDKKGTKYHYNTDAWEKIAMFTSGDQVELIATGNTNLPNSMGAATNLAAFITAFDGAVGVASGFATLGADGKVPAGQLPASIAGGMQFIGALNLGTSKTFEDLTSAGMNTEGEYFIVTTGGDLISGGLITGTVQAPGDEGSTSLPLTLEAGDWVVCIAQDIGGASTMTVAIIDNDYQTASTSAAGVVTLSSASTRAGLSGNSVVTDGVLATILNDDIIVDGDFASAGFMKTDGSGGYSVDNSTFLTQTSFNSGNNELAALQSLVDTAGFLKKTGDGGYTIDTNTYLTSETSHSDVLVDGEFASAGLMTTDGSGGYSITSTSAYQTKVTVDSGAPSGGADGDLWIVTS